MYEVYVGLCKDMPPRYGSIVYVTSSSGIPEMVIDKAFLVNVMWLLRAVRDTNTPRLTIPTSSNWLASVF
jgi:hypothetical protein